MHLSERDIAAGQSDVSHLISQLHENIVTADLVAVSGSLADNLRSNTSRFFLAFGRMFLRRHEDIVETK